MSNVKMVNCHFCILLHYLEGEKCKKLESLNFGMICETLMILFSYKTARN